LATSSRDAADNEVRQFRSPAVSPFAGFALRRFRHSPVSPFAGFAIRRFRRSAVSPFGGFAIRRFRRSAFSPFGVFAIRRFRRSAFSPFVSLKVVTPLTSHLHRSLDENATLCEPAAASGKAIANLYRQPSALVLFQRPTCPNGLQIGA
jgi:hypothetical protein